MRKRERGDTILRFVRENIWGTNYKFKLCVFSIPIQNQIDFQTRDSHQYYLFLVQFSSSYPTWNFYTYSIWCSKSPFSRSNRDSKLIIFWSQYRKLVYRFDGTLWRYVCAQQIINWMCRRLVLFGIWYILCYLWKVLRICEEEMFN